VCYDFVCYTTNIYFRDVIRDAFNAGYDHGYNDGYADGYDAGISDGVQTQVQTQIADAAQDQQNNQPMTSLDEALNDTNYVFGAEDLISVQTQSGTSCQLSKGDYLQVAQAPSEQDQSVWMKVVSAKRSSCPKNSVVAVSMDQLNAMLEAFYDRAQKALDETQSNQDQLQGEVPGDNNN
jgi:hypothetical protein